MKPTTKKKYKKKDSMTLGEMVQRTIKVLDSMSPVNLNNTAVHCKCYGGRHQDTVIYAEPQVDCRVKKTYIPFLYYAMKADIYEAESREVYCVIRLHKWFPKK